MVRLLRQEQRDASIVLSGMAVVFRGKRLLDVLMKFGAVFIFSLSVKEEAKLQTVKRGQKFENREMCETLCISGT